MAEVVEVEPEEDQYAEVVEVEPEDRLYIN
jgi:hypothetical protein